MRIRTHSMVAIVVFLGALALAASQARAASEFTLGPSTLTLGTETDSTADGGCMNGTTNNGCDSYKFKVPITVDPKSDIGDDLKISSDDLGIGISSAEFCNVVTPPDLEIDIPHSSLSIKKTHGEDTVKFTGMAAAFFEGGSQEMVPVKLLIQVNRNTNKGFLMVSGVGDLSPMHGNSSGFVGLFTTEGDQDGDTDFGCTSVTQKNTNQN